MNTAQRIAPQRLDPGAHGDKGEIDFGQLLELMWRGKWRIGVCVMLGFLAAFAYINFVATPRYTAYATVALENREQNVSGLEGVVSSLGGDFATINTEIYVLKARGLVAKLVDKLGLENDPEFNYTLRTPNSWSPGAIIGSATGALRELIAGPPDAFVMDPAAQAKMVYDLTVDAVAASIRISNVEYSYVYQIAVETTDPAKSARIANTLAELYILQQLELKFEATEQATVWLAERVAELKSELESAQNAVKSFNASAELISPELLESLNRQVKVFRDQLTDMEQQERRLETQLAATLSTGGTSEQARIALDRQLVQTVNRKAALENTIADLEGRIAVQSADLLKLEQLEREADAIGALYESFLNRLKETEVQVGIQTADSRILSEAPLPISPSKPRGRLITMASLFLGFIAGGGLVLLRELRQNNFRSAKELEATTGFSVIGRIPKVAFTRRRKMLEHILAKSTSALSEAVRNLRTSILLSNVDRPPQIIMVASTVPGEGKTTLSLALAHSLAGLGRRILLVEGDIRRHTLQQYFDVEGREGLLGVVAGEIAFEDAVHSSDKVGIDVLFSERSAINATDFFSSEHFAQFLDEMRNRYDYIVIDTPPVMVVPDARVIGQQADTVIYNVHWGKTPRQLVLQGLDAFDSVNVKVSGLVLTHIDAKEAQRYGENYVTYGYKYYRS